jgi:hypothetical protein
MLIVNALWLVVVEAPFVEASLFWIAILVYIAASVVSDCVIVMLHRRYSPVLGEPFFSTMRRLTKPGQHWPNYQSESNGDQEANKPVGSTWTLAMEAKWSQHPVFKDEILTMMLVLYIVMGFIPAGLVAIYGRCHIWDNPSGSDLC